jgi:uncharacterized protein (TIGR03437 family)
MYWPLRGALLFGVLYAFATLVKHACAEPAYGNDLSVLGKNLLDPNWTDISQTVLIVLCMALAWFTPRLGRQQYQRIESMFSRFADHRRKAIVLAGLLPLLIRFALLPALPVPQPEIADEFGYLLIADTLASGRLTNPPHPMWTHFEETYVQHQPTYTSVYPLAQPLVLALPKMLGLTPWLGVCLSVGMMCASICWAFQGWMPPRWALLGALIAAFRFSVASSWMNTYWGGAVAAMGGAVLVGALGRVLRGDRLLKNSLLFGLGLAMVVESRPYEGVAFAIPMFVVLAFWFCAENSISWSTRFRHVAMPLAAVLLVIIGGTAYYNWRVTGNPMLLPPVLQQKVYGMPQSFLWQSPILDAPRVHRYKEIADTFHWQLKAYRKGLSWEVAGARLQAFWRFFLQPVLSLPLLVLAWRTRKKWPWWLALGIALLLIANFQYPFFFPHYAAPAYAALLLLSVEGLRCLRTIRWFHRPIGLFLSRAIVVLTFLSAAAVAIGAMLLPGAIVRAESARSWVSEQLQRQGGTHLVLVRYNRDHSLDYPIIYNDANIDRSAIVWAHAIDSVHDQELINYFRNRQAWLFNPDELPFKLIPYAEPFISAVVNAAGQRYDREQGVSPGGIGVILGANFIDRDDDFMLQSRSILHGLPFELAETSEQVGDVFKPLKSTPPGTDDGLPLPLQRGDVSVKFNGIPAPIFSLSKIHRQEAVTVQVPVEVAVGRAILTIRVGKRTATAKVKILPVTPGILEIRRPDSTRQAIILRPDGSLVDLKHPARRGESLRFLATGLGPLDPPVMTNQPGSSPSSAIVHSITVGIHHGGVPFLYARYAPGLVGVEEIGFQVPKGAPSGTAEPFAIFVTMNGKAVFGNSSWIPVE